MNRYFISRNTGKEAGKTLIKVLSDNDNITYECFIKTWEYNNVSLPCRIREFKTKLKEINTSIFNEIDEEHYNRVIHYLDNNAIGN